MKKLKFPLTLMVIIVPYIICLILMEFACWLFNKTDKSIIWFDEYVNKVSKETEK